MIKNPKFTQIGEEVHDDIIELIKDIDTVSGIHYSSKPYSNCEIKIKSILLTLVFGKWSYLINYEIGDKNMNFYTSERHSSLDNNKIEEYLDKHMTQIIRDEKIREIL